MNLILPAEQQRWLEAQVADGHFPSIEAAAEAAIAAAMAGDTLLDAGDLSWAKPYADQGREDVACGRVLTLEEHRARMAARLEALKR
jgi:antitoxin ParD1/3/4